MRFLTSFVVLVFVAITNCRGQETLKGGVDFPRPTPATLDSLLQLGVVPVWIDIDPTMYWRRSRFSIMGRASHRSYMTQALEGGYGVEGSIGVPFGVTDFGAYLFARANDYTVLDREWLGWITAGERKGVAFNGGGGASFGIPLKWPGIFIPLSMNFGAAFFQSEGNVPAETYLSIEPGLGFRYRATPMLAVHGMAQTSYLFALTERNRNIGSWNFSLGLEVALAPHSREPLQHWVPPLVATARDVVELLGSEPVAPLNILDRNLDFINTTFKPLTRIGWYPLGFRGIVQGTVIHSSRASSGNVTALDIELDSAPRSFRVWRTQMLLDSTRALTYLIGNGDTTRPSVQQEKIIIDRIKRGDYAYRDRSDLDDRYIRIELFPWAKGPLNQIPTVGSRVAISGEIMWDGDGHVELHPQRPTDVKIITGEFLYSDDERSLE